MGCTPTGKLVVTDVPQTLDACNNPNALIRSESPTLAELSLARCQAHRRSAAAPHVRSAEILGDGVMVGIDASSLMLHEARQRSGVAASLSATPFVHGTPARAR